MKRTQAFVRVSDSLERDILLDHLDDVRLEAEVVDELLRKQCHVVIW
jgi:hypothetical protein